jgi:hypothetical protein
MRKGIKTRGATKGIIALDKSASLAGYMKDGLAKAKGEAEETQGGRHASPTEYAANTLQEKANDVVDQAIRHMPNPVREVRENGRSTRTHFAEARRQTAGGRRQLAANIGKKAAVPAEATLKESTKGASKTVKKPVKSAGQSTKATSKTSQQAAEAAQKIAQASARAAEAAAKAAQAAGKTTVQTAKIAANITASTVKAAIATLQGLEAAIIAGGCTAVLFIVVICMIGSFSGSIYGIFFSGENNPAGQNVNEAIAGIDDGFTAMIDGIIESSSYDSMDMTGARAPWKHVLAVYTVKTVSDPDNPMDVSVMTGEKAAILQRVYWDTNHVDSWIETIEHIEYQEQTDYDGEVWWSSYTWHEYILHIRITHKTPEEMAEQYGFGDEQREWLGGLLKPEYNSLWNALLYGTGSVCNGTLIGVADTQIGNVGGETYWRWYGFNSRVEWCAVFVSWAAGQCGYIDAEILPLFSACETGIQWFKNHGQWQNGGYTPAAGDIIFFDWEADGECDHVGIVESMTGSRVNTIEGNSGNAVKRRSYGLGSIQIIGYGIPAYS